METRTIELEWGLVRNPFAHEKPEREAKAKLHLSRIQDDIGWITVNGVPLADVLEVISRQLEHEAESATPSVIGEPWLTYAAVLRALAGRDSDE